MSPWDVAGSKKFEGMPIAARLPKRTSLLSSGYAERIVSYRIVSLAVSSSSAVVIDQVDRLIGRHLG